MSNAKPICTTKNIVFKATVATSNPANTKHYIGMTASTFKERCRNHKKQFKYSNKTELSKNIWKLKNKNEDFNIKITGQLQNAIFCAQENKKDQFM